MTKIECKSLILTSGAKGITVFEGNNMIQNTLAETVQGSSEGL